MSKQLYVPNVDNFVTHSEVLTQRQDYTKKQTSNLEPITLVSPVQAAVDRAASELMRLNESRNHGVIGGYVHGRLNNDNFIADNRNK